MANGWGPMLRLAVQHYSIAPADFWRLSLTEWRALAGASVAPILGRTDFEALAAEYPDEKERP